MIETTIRVDKGIPIPRSGRPQVGHYKNRYPWDAMGIGDSFRSDKPTGMMRSAARARSIDRPTERYTIRRDGDGCRVWRVR